MKNVLRPTPPTGGVGLQQSTDPKFVISFFYPTYCELLELLKIGGLRKGVKSPFPQSSNSRLQLTDAIRVTTS